MVLSVTNLAACVTLVLEACLLFDVTLDEILEYNIQKLKERYPNGFDA